MSGEPGGLGGAAPFALPDFAAALAVWRAVGALAAAAVVQAGAHGMRIRQAGGEGGCGFLPGVTVFLSGEAADFLLIVRAPLVARLAALVFAHPAIGRHVVGAGGHGDAELLAAQLVEMFGEGPVGLEGSVGSDVGLIGSEGAAVGSGSDAGGGLLGGGIFLAGFGAGGAGEGMGGDLAHVGDGAGGGGLHVAGEDAVGGLGEDELDGGEIFEEGDGDFAAFLGAEGEAVVFVSEAEVVAVEGGGVALEAGDGEGAAAAAVVGFGSGGVGGRLVGFEHRFSFGER
ncbi:MAG TPA: hypothetical protein VHX37_11500 [Acidobacteriaceae bacterium]|nr:hypothetical protein [Acidobacteriaceae bacterium]